MVQYHDSVESDDTDSDDDLPTLDEIVDSDDEDEVDTIEAPVYSWIHISSRSLSRKHKRILQVLQKENHLEFDDNGQVHSIWKVSGFAKLDNSDSKIFVCYYDATLPKPKDSDSFEYTDLNTFMAWAVPESR